MAQHSSLIKKCATGSATAVWNRLFQGTLPWQSQWRTLSGQPTSQLFVPCESSARVTVSRTELVAILVITVAGFAARFAFLNELAIEHFDEGVYASNLWFPDEGYQYPDRFLYAPPLLPSLIEWSMILVGEARWVPFLPSLILGSLTVPLAWWSVRRWSSGASGVAAAGLLSLNDFHISMSRSALTDAPMVFFLLLAVWLAVEALADRNLRLSAMAGFVTGLAWATKYNGWLPVAIAVSGSAAACILWPRAKSPDELNAGRLSIGSIIACLAVLTLAAAATWFPVWWDLQPIGGYARVADNHRNYVTGFAEWWSAAVRHEAVQRHYAGWPTLLSGWLAVISSALVFRVERSTWNETSPHHDSSDGGSIHAAEPGVKRSTWNEFNFIKTVAMTAALVGAVALSPVVALGIWSLIELIASGKSVRRIHQQRLESTSSRTTENQRPSKSRSKKATGSAPARDSFCHCFVSGVSAPDWRSFDCCMADSSLADRQCRLSIRRTLRRRRVQRQSRLLATSTCRTNDLQVRDQIGDRILKQPGCGPSGCRLSSAFASGERTIIAPRRGRTAQVWQTSPSRWSLPLPKTAKARNQSKTSLLSSCTPTASPDSCSISPVREPRSYPSWT